MSQLTSVQRLALWTERLDRFQSADLTVAEFCRRELVSVPSFYNWKKRLGQSSTSKRPVKRTSQADPKFTPLVLNTDTAIRKLNLPGGASIELASTIGRDQLTDLIAAVIKATDQNTTDKESL